MDHTHEIIDYLEAETMFFRQCLTESDLRSVINQYQSGLTTLQGRTQSRQPSSGQTEGPQTLRRSGRGPEVQAGRMPANCKSQQDSFLKMVMRVEQTIFDFQKRMRTKKPKDTSETSDIFQIFTGYILEIVRPDILRIDNITKPPSRTALAQSMYTVEFMESLVHCQTYAAWYKYVRARAMALTLFFANKVHQQLKKAPEDLPLLPLLLIIQKVERNWHIPSLYPAKEIPMLISNGEQAPPITRYNSWKAEQEHIGKRDWDLAGWFDSHLPYSHRHVMGNIISDSSVRLNNNGTTRGHTTLGKVLFANGQMTKLQEIIMDGQGIYNLWTAVRSDNRHKVAKFKIDKERYHKAMWLRDNPVNPNDLRSDRADEPLEIKPNPQRHIRFIFNGGNDNLDSKNAAIGANDPTVLPRRVNKQTKETYKLVDALTEGPGIAVVVVAIQAQAYNLHDIWERLQVQAMKAGIERNNQYVKLQQTYLEKLAELNEQEPRNARELLGNQMVGDLVIPDKGVYNPKVMFVPMTTFTDNLEMCDAIHFANTPKNRMIISDIVESLVDAAFYTFPYVYDIDGDVPKPYEDAEKRKYPVTPTRDSIFHLTTATEYDHVLQDIPMPKYMSETTQNMVDLCIQSGWKQVQEHDCYRDLTRPETIKEQKEDIGYRTRQWERVMYPMQLKRVSDPFGEIAHAALLCMTAKKNPHIKMWIETVWQTAPEQELDEDGKPMHYMEYLLQRNKSCYRIGEKRNIDATYEMVEAGETRMKWTLSIIEDQIDKSIDNKISITRIDELRAHGKAAVAVMQKLRQVKAQLQAIKHIAENNQYT
ncbi:MAG: hypothetical protein NZ744_11550, partial [Pirellulaceae bacterium]|nr:hypothetical protein [Pirellulaceae bacterium]